MSQSVSEQPPPYIDEYTRKEALRRTAEVLGECDRIRRSLELPPEALGRVLELYVSSARAVSSEKEQADLAARMQRVPLVMYSHDNTDRPLCLGRGVITPVRVRPHWLTYRVEEIEINGDPTHWNVHDIKVGNVSQFSAGGSLPIPGERFCKGGIMSNLRLDNCQTAMAFDLIVEYVGPLIEGDVFWATLVGTGMKNARG